MADFYTSEEETGDLPLEPFAGLHIETISVAQRILQVLEACEWKWTINEILDQPVELLDTIINLRANGMRMKMQMSNKKEGKF